MASLRDLNVASVASEKAPEGLKTVVKVGDPSNSAINRYSSWTILYFVLDGLILDGPVQLDEVELEEPVRATPASMSTFLLHRY